MPTRIAIAVVEHEGQFLIGQRPPGVPLAGYWEFPGGKIQGDETPEQCAVRECFEETGCTVEVQSTYPAVVHKYHHDTLQLHFLACRLIDASSMPQPPFRWVRRAQLSEFAFPPANAAILEYLLRQPG